MIKEIHFLYAIIVSSIYSNYQGVSIAWLKCWLWQRKCARKAADCQMPALVGRQKRRAKKTLKPYEKRFETYVWIVMYVVVWYEKDTVVYKMYIWSQVNIYMYFGWVWVQLSYDYNILFYPILLWNTTSLWQKPICQVFLLLLASWGIVKIKSME